MLLESQRKTGEVLIYIKSNNLGKKVDWRNTIFTMDTTAFMHYRSSTHKTRIRHLFSKIHEVGDHFKHTVDTVDSS